MASSQEKRWTGSCPSQKCTCSLFHFAWFVWFVFSFRVWFSLLSELRWSHFSSADVRTVRILFAHLLWTPVVPMGWIISTFILPFYFHGLTSIWISNIVSWSQSALWARCFHRVDDSTWQMKHRQQWLCGFLAQDFRGGRHLRWRGAVMASVLEFVYLCVPVPNNVAVAGHDHKKIPRNIKRWWKSPYVIFGVRSSILIRDDHPRKTATPSRKKEENNAPLFDQNLTNLLFFVWLRLGIGRGATIRVGSPRVAPNGKYVTDVSGNTREYQMHQMRRS